MVCDLFNVPWELFWNFWNAQRKQLLRYKATRLCIYDEEENEVSRLGCI